MNNMSKQENKKEVFNPIAQRKPPHSQGNVWYWMRLNLFSSPISMLLTVIAVAMLYAIIPPIFNWLVLDASWVGETQGDCDRQGACWVFVEEKFLNFIYGFTPAEQYWRFNVVFLTFPLLVVPLFMKGFSKKNAFFITFPVLCVPLLTDGLAQRTRVFYGIALFFGYPIVGYFFILGIPGVQCDPNDFKALCHIPTTRWGGLSLTIILAYVGIIASIPIGVILALGRISRLPVVRAICVGFIEAWRGVPLITILFTASVVFPIFLPAGVEFDKLLRALIGITLFESAYMAEVIRGGLQSVPNGQHEAADALGLTYWQKINNIVLPQALRVVIPSIVGTSISLVKDTTLVTIIGLLDVLAVVTAASADSNWLGFETEGYVLVAFFFWVLCFSLSRYSYSVEKKLNVTND